MGTRSGDLDPSVVTYIANLRNHTPDEMDEILNKKSGVYGISEVSVDFRDIESEAADGDKNAIMALDNFAYHVAQYIAKYMVSMGGVDNIVFTAGVGENQINRRAGICKKLEFLGVKLDVAKNQTKGEEIEISAPDSKIKVWVIPTNEELVIARETMKLANIK